LCGVGRLSVIRLNSGGRQRRAARTVAINRAGAALGLHVVFSHK